MRHVPFDLAAAGLELLVVDTRAHHALTDGQYGSRREQCERAAALLGVRWLRDIAPGDLDAALARLRDLVDDPEEADETGRRVRHVVTEIQRVRDTVALVEAGDLAGVGPMLDASHASLRDDYEVSCVELDLACASAVEARRARCADDRRGVRGLGDRAGAPWRHRTRWPTPSPPPSPRRT